MPENLRETLLRQYAVGAITWHELRERGFEDYIAVLGGLGELGLRPPIAAMTGPNVAARERGRAILRQALRQAALDKTFGHLLPQGEKGRRASLICLSKRSCCLKTAMSKSGARWSTNASA